MRHLATILQLFLMLLAAYLPVCAKAQAAKEGERSYAPLAVLPFRPGSDYQTYDWQTATNLLTERVADKLSNSGVEVVARETLDTLGINQEQYRVLNGTTELDLGVRLGKAKGARFILSGRVDDVNIRVFRVAFLQRTEVKVNVSARLINVEKQVVIPGCIFEVEGKKTKDGLNLNGVLGEMLTQNDSLRSLYIEACKDLSAKLAQQVLDKYPQVPKEPGHGPSYAQWTDELDGKGVDEAGAQKDARLTMLRRVTEALTEPRVRTENGDLINKEIYGECERFTTAEKIRDGRYKVGVNLSLPTGDDASLALALPTRLQELHLMHQLKVIVFVPETHLALARLPDPAGETKLRERLQEMGFYIVDFERADQLRKHLLDRLANGGELDATSLDTLRQDYPADILVWGEGISQRNEASRVGVEQVSVSARVEVRAVWMADGHVLASKSSHAAGLGGSEAIAAKQALLNAGDLVAPQLAQSIFTTAYSLVRDADHAAGGASDSNTPRISADTSGNLTLVITGYSEIAAVRPLQRALEKIAGISEVNRKLFKDRTVTFMLRGDSKVLKQLSDLLDENATLKVFHLAIDSEENGILTCHIKTAPVH